MLYSSTIYHKDTYKTDTTYFAQQDPKSRARTPDRVIQRLEDSFSFSPGKALKTPSNEDRTAKRAFSPLSAPFQAVNCSEEINSCASSWTPEDEQVVMNTFSQIASFVLITLAMLSS